MISQPAPNAIGKLPPASEPIFKPDLVRRMLLSIFGGTWKAGERLREEKLAAFFQVSRTPIREALQELAAVGLVELRPNCGALVASFGPREVEEIYEVRALLEAEATRLAGEHISKEELQSLQEELTDLLAAPSRSAAWSQRTWEADRHLHGLIATRCPNHRLTREIARYETFVQMVRETVGNRNHFQDVALKEHKAVIAALLRGDSLKAAEAMRAHILNAGQIAVEAIRPILASRKTRTTSAESAA
ncbi:MAG TPA: GntR family transcriptional regulator [Chthoniobacter sp.]|nr:GntR family transcriptional regulator [Chthoniobacter sp.]